MPELPEVETVCRGMKSSMIGKIISLVEIKRDGLRWPFPDKMGDRITGQTVSNITRRAKYILVELASNETIIIHLGMSGRILIKDKPTAVFLDDKKISEKHDHIKFYLNDGFTIIFNDARRFGAMDLVLTRELDNHWLLKKIGPEPLGNSLNSEYLLKAFKKKSISIKTALLDQQLIAGLGNIYACEILYRSKISPNQKVKQLSKKRIEKLIQIIRIVLLEAIDAGGSSLKDHRQTSGEIGYFQYNFTVYGRMNEKCLKNDCEAKVKRILQGGRSTFYCPKCQR
tara:strand:+ start:2532 stop:3383 length:852 start_codon:yes stop_codon:yes gene_type:complete